MGTLPDIYSMRLQPYSFTYIFPQAQAEFLCSEVNMPFRTGYRSPGVFLNDDFCIVQRAYASVVSEYWEPFGPERADIARYVMRLYDRGIVDPEKLKTLTAMHFRTRLHILRTT